jgi:hypothetical protein
MCARAVSACATSKMVVAADDASKVHDASERCSNYILHRCENATQPVSACIRQHDTDVAIERTVQLLMQARLI